MARMVEARGSAPKAVEVDRKAVASVAPWFYSPNWDSLIVNDSYVRMLVIDGYMSWEDLGWGMPFVGLGGINAPVTVVMAATDGEELRSSLSKTANEAMDWTIEQVNASYMDVKEKEYESEQASLAADMILRTNAKMYEVYIYIGLRAPDERALDVITERARQIAKGRQMSVATFAANQGEMFWAASPLLIEDAYLRQRLNYNMPSTTVSQALFNREKGICDPIGIPLGTDGQQGLIRINFLERTGDRPNGNVMIIAESGSGKSALVKHLILYLRTLCGCRIIINDVDGEFTKLTRALGGEVVYLDEKMRLTPFEPRNIASDGIADREDDGSLVTDEEIAESRRRALQAKVLSTHLPFLTTFLRKSFEISGKNEKDILWRACERAYLEYGIDQATTFEEYYAGDRRYPSLADLYRVLGEMRGEGDFLDYAETIGSIRLSMLKGVEGSDRHIWEGDPEPMPDAQIICINMQGLSADEQTKAAQYYNVQTWEWSQIRSNRYSDQHVYIVNDELHVSVNEKNIDAALFTKDMAQRIRKYGAGLISTTQMVSDLLHDSIRSAGEGIIYNASYQLFGKTSGDPDKVDSNMRETQALLNVPNETMKKLSRAGKGRFICRVGTERQSWLEVMRLPQWELDLFGKGGGR